MRTSPAAVLAERVRAVSATCRGAARGGGGFLALRWFRRQNGYDGDSEAEGEATQERSHRTDRVIGSFMRLSGSAILGNITTTVPADLCLGLNHLGAERTLLFPLCHCPSIQTFLTRLEDQGVGECHNEQS